MLAVGNNARDQCSQYCCVHVTNADNIAVCSRRMIENVAVTSFDPSVFNRTVTYVYVAANRSPALSANLKLWFMGNEWQLIRLTYPCRRLRNITSARILNATQFDGLKTETLYDVSVRLCHHLACMFVV
jgi:hypothetical protein